MGAQPSRLSLLPPRPLLSCGALEASTPGEHTEMPRVKDHMAGACVSAKCPRSGVSGALFPFFTTLICSFHAAVLQTLKCYTELLRE